MYTAPDSSPDNKLLKTLLKKKQAALREAERRVELLSKDGQRSFDPNAPRGGSESKSGKYLCALELLMKEECEKEEKLGGGGKGNSAKKDKELDLKVVLQELLKVSSLWCYNSQS